MSDTKTQPFAKLRSAKIGSELSPIGRGLLQIGPFCFPAFIFRDDELQDSLLGLNPLTKRGCSAIFTDQNFSLLHLITNRLLRNISRLGRNLLGQKTYITSGPAGTILTITRNSKGVLFRKSKGALIRKSKGALTSKTKGV